MAFPGSAIVCATIFYRYGTPLECVKHLLFDLIVKEARLETSPTSLGSDAKKERTFFEEIRLKKQKQNETPIRKKQWALTKLKF